MRGLAAAPLLLLGACAMIRETPGANVDVTGSWTVVAIDGEPTGGGRGFNLELKPTYGSAQFGCNTGSGSYVVRNGWLVTGDWIITAASCLHKETWLRFEHEGFQVLSKPLAIQRTPGGVRLRNALGSIDLKPTAPVTAAEIAGEWNVASIGEVVTPGGSSFRVTFTARGFAGYFGCNEFRGIYDRGHEGLRLVPVGNTEIGGDGPVMQFENSAEAILQARPQVVPRSDRGVDLVSPNGTIRLVRQG